ncbi:C2H2-type zinc finger protein [Candidatus Sororendozoicomonas aggregata]|uniref:C2H2-type zinc finger protein n=1 Tax=Candidatus Sororendozoicomonas aggregata TaxID=3073239 RepID=UPI002ED3EF25
MPNPNPIPIPDDLICTLCNRKLSRKDAFRRHMQIHAGADQKFKCPHCDKLFYRTDRYRIHVRNHTGERPFPCLHPGCGKAFTTNRDLIQHRAQVHMGERRFKCQHCQKSFKRSTHLKVHIKTVHGETSNQVVTTTNTETLPDGTTTAYISHKFTATGITVYQLRSDTGTAMVTVAESPQATTTNVTQSRLPKPITVTTSVPAADCFPIVPDIFPDIFPDLPDDLQQMSAKYDFDSDKAAAPDV